MKRGATLIRWGYSLPELVLACALLGLVSLTAARGLAHHLDRIAVGTAVAEAAGAVARARDEALARHAMVTVHIDTVHAVLALRSGGAPLARYALGHAHGVSLGASRDSLSFDVRGLGYGAANVTLIARRGTAADTLVVSRLGRTRY